jgi:hypothetical protein
MASQTLGAPSQLSFRQAQSPFEPERGGSIILVAGNSRRQRKSSSQREAAAIDKVSSQINSSNRGRIQQPPQVASKQGLSDNHKLALIRLCIRHKDTYGSVGYWPLIATEFKSETGIVHLTLQRVVTALTSTWQKTFDLRGSETGTENDDDMAIAMREWLEVVNKDKRQKEAVKLRSKAAVEESSAILRVRNDMLQGHKRKAASQDDDNNTSPSLNNDDSGSEVDNSPPPEPSERTTLSERPAVNRTSSSTTPSARAHGRAKRKRGTAQPEEKTTTAEAVKSVIDYFKSKDQKDVEMSSMKQDIQEMKELLKQQQNLVTSLLTLQQLPRP